MKIILMPFILLMLPVAFIVVCFDVAMAVVEEALLAKIEEEK